MLASDYKKAQELSKQLKGLGYKPKPIEKKVKNLDFLNHLTGLSIPKIKPIKVKPKPTPFKFDYKALTVKDGRNGRDGRTPTAEELLALMKPLVQQAMAETELPEIEVTDDLVKAIIQKMHTLPENDKLEASLGIRNAQSFIFGGTKYKTSELMHGGSASSGNGYQVPISGNVDGVNRTFVWALAPNVIVLDNGNAMNRVSSDGTINWTGTTTTVLAQTPNYNIYAMA